MIAFIASETILAIGHDTWNWTAVGFTYIMEVIEYLIFDFEVYWIYWDHVLNKWYDTRYYLQLMNLI